MRRALAFRKSYLMRIRRRDKDPAEIGGSEQPGVAPYDYDQEPSDVPDPAVPVAEPTSADPVRVEPAPPQQSPSPPAAPDEALPPVSPATKVADVVPEAPIDTAAEPVPPASEPATPASGEATPAPGPGPMPAGSAPPPPPPAMPAPIENAAAEPEAAETAATGTAVVRPGPGPDEAVRPSSAPKHAMRAPSIGDEATELLNGSKPAPRELPRIIAIANQKGGVGKTTTTVNLGAALAEFDYRVLVIDLDPQGNATTGLGVEARNFELSMYDVIMRDQPLEDCIEPTSVKNLFVAPATIDLAGVEIELVPAFSREMKLKRAIDTVVDDFDFVLIDCPPSLGLITVNGLAAADEVLVPIQCEYYALEGLSQLLRNVNLVSTNLNQTLEVSTIVLTMYDARTRLSVDVANEVREHFSERVCRAVIPRTVRLSEAPSFGQPITVFDPTSRGAVAYRELAKEVSNGAPQRSR
jgi:chromosome partitioning protein